MTNLALDGFRVAGANPPAFSAHSILQPGYAVALSPFTTAADSQTSLGENLHRTVLMNRTIARLTSDTTPKSTTSTSTRNNALLANTRASGSGSGSGSSTVSGVVWLDSNGDGLLDNGELGLRGITVNLDDPLGDVLMSTTTDQYGNYSFNFSLSQPTPYRIQVILPNGETATQENVATNGINSNINALGLSPVFALAPGGSANQFAGLIQGPPVIFTVSANTDTGVGTGYAGDLRYCMTQAAKQVNIGAIIEFQNNVDWTIKIGAFPLPTIGENTTIIVPSSSQVTVQGSATAQNLYSIFSVASNVTAEIDNLTIMDGYAVNGGGVDNNGNLTLGSDVIEDNHATNGGGVYNADTVDPPALSLINVELVENAASAVGGGLGNFGGNVIICGNCSIHSNEAFSGGGLYTDKFVGNVGTITCFTLPTIGSPSIYFNQAAAPGGLNCNGGGVAVGTGGDFNMYGGTIGAPGFLNSATRFGGGIYSAGTVLLVGVTVQNNKAGFGGGGMYLAQGSNTTLISVIVQNNKLNGGAGVGIYEQNGSNQTIIGLTDNDDPGGKPVQGP